VELRSVTPKVEVERAPLAASLEEACARWAERPAVTYRGRTMTYLELGQRVGSLASAYRGMGIAPGERIICQLLNCPEHLIAVNAAWACGAIHAGTDNDLTGSELSSLVERTRAAVLVFQPRPDGPDPLAPLRAVRATCPNTRILLHGPVLEADHDLYDHLLSELLAPVPTGSDNSIEPSFGPEETALLLLTSGTTGKPKAVRETLPHCWAKMQFFADAFDPGPGDVHLVYLPMGHVFGLRLSLIPVLSGGRLVLLDRFSPDAALELVGEEGVTVLPGMPTHFTLLLSKHDPVRHRVGNLRWAISAAAALPRNLVDAIYDRLGVDLLFVYGCSEGFTTLSTDRREISAGSVGKAVFRGPEGTAPNGTVTVLDPIEGAPLQAGEVGEIAFGTTCPVEYWDEPSVAMDGWYRTGDLGRVDADGCVHVLGRLKELVNRGGLKVSPTEVETAITRHPAVADAAIVAAPDPVLGEAICACLVPGDARPPDLPELRSFLADSLARHKLPDELAVVANIPRTKIGKVDRSALAGLALEPGRPRQRLRRG
jgi:acyl-CoA synthetase (AMP-forming)/AMP-acid ligase II